jgi:hypothetical protein
MEYTDIWVTLDGTPSAESAAKCDRVIHRATPKEEEMSPISTPTKRTYYPASPTEKDRLLLWIPRDELEGMAEENLLPPSVLEDYPDGVEVEVTPSGFDELGLDLGVSPDTIKALYGQLAERGQVPQSGLVDGAALERAAREVVTTEADAGPPRFTPDSLEPEMSDGEEAQTFLRGLE